MNELLLVRDLQSGTWKSSVSLDVKVGEVALLLGPNSSGKTTLLHTIAGLAPVRSGQIWFNGKDVTNLDIIERAAIGMRLAVEARQVFGRLTVKKNLLLGAYHRKRGQNLEAELERVLDIFPGLREKLGVPAASLSGGQQTMVNIGRALMGNPKLLLMDEPTLGLDPQNTAKLIRALEHLRPQLGILVAEQGGQFVKAFSDRVLVMGGGEILFDGPWEQAVQARTVNGTLALFSPRSGKAAQGTST